MKINKNENIVLVDVDMTLILPQQGNNYFVVDYYGIKKHVRPHQENIDLLKSYRARGYYVRVHSNNGWKWAEEVVNGLNLQEYVDSIETKPCKWVDDSENANEVIGQRVYIKPS